MTEPTPLRLYNTLTRTKEAFTPLDASNVRMYVCGPTVYDYAHIGNARPVIVFDVLFRLLRHLYGEKHVTYVRNITDVDDKINDRAARDFPDLPLNEAIRRVTESTGQQFKRDVAALGNLEPTVEPRATEHIDEMRQIIEMLIAGGFAYVAEGHVLFSPAAMNAADGVLPRYGALANRSLDEMIAGARVDVAPYKKDSTDFVLWKPSKEGEPGWPSPAGIAGLGRPGWHIECSAMSWKHLGEVFDIHGGGIDLVFPHHENEVAQSTCAFGHPVMANVFMHNGFLQVEGEKMSKSAGNFYTINELLETDRFGGRSWPGEVLRLVMLKTHYRQPIDWTISSLAEAEDELAQWWEIVGPYVSANRLATKRWRKLRPPRQFIDALSDDLNTSDALFVLRTLAKQKDAQALLESAEFLGLMRPGRHFSFDRRYVAKGHLIASKYQVALMRELQVAEQNKRAKRKNAIQTHLLEQGVTVEIGSAGSLSYSVERRLGSADNSLSKTEIEFRIRARIAARNAKNWAESDRIRDQLAAMGIQLNDGKDPVTGELVTTWDIKR